MSVAVKALTHWIIYKGYKVRFKTRTPTLVTGILTTPAGEVTFRYVPQTRQITLPTAEVTINEYGWEIKQESESS